MTGQLWGAENGKQTASRTTRGQEEGKLEGFWKNVSALPALSKGWCTSSAGESPKVGGGLVPSVMQRLVDEVARRRQLSMVMQAD